MHPRLAALQGLPEPLPPLGDNHDESDTSRLDAALSRATMVKTHQPLACLFVHYNIFHSNPYITTLHANIPHD
jgi:hypothetical protein